MAGDGDGLFASYMQAVKRHFDSEDYEKALSMCAEAAQSGGKANAAVVLRCRVYALLQLSRWADALSLCEKESKDGLAFEKAYCMYRLNRFQEALNTLEKDKSEDHPNKKRLEAQVKYRMHDYEACAGMYEELYKAEGDETGLLVNAAAAHISGDKPHDALNLLKEQHELLESSYELCFNLACALIDEGKLGQAEERLSEAKRICVQELIESEDMDEAAWNAGEVCEEDHAELVSINVQRACVLQRCGATEEATELYNRVLRQRSDQEVDITVLAVACNNVVALRSEGKSLFDSLKRINVASKESLEHKLTRKQTIQIAVNKCLLLLQAHKSDEAKRELQRLRTSHPDHPAVAIVQAAIAHSEKKLKVCEESLQSYLKEHPGSEEVLLCLAQLFAQQKRMDKAVEALAQLPMQCRAQPGTIEAIATLHQRQQSPEKAIACIRDAITYWTSDDRADEETLASVLRIAARLAKQLKDPDLSAEVYQLYLEKVDGSDMEALCGLVQSLAGTDVSKAEQYAQRLRPPSYEHLDAEELESAAMPKLAPPTKKRAESAADKAAASAAEEGEDGEGKPEEKKKRRRKRTIRYPKNFDPENPGPKPDPERGLPKRERTDNKKRMRKRDKGLLRGSQGSMPVDDNAFRKQGPSTAQVEVAKDNTTGGKPRNQGKRNKGKK
jgi:signal recognition particle subunit SRP72